MAGGQMLDLEAETRRFDLDENPHHASHENRGIDQSRGCGGRVGGADDRLLSALAKYAEHLGLAFQIADDILDRQSDAAAMGKPTGRDETAGKASFVDVMGIDAATSEAHQLVENANAILAESVENYGLA